MTGMRTIYRVGPPEDRHPEVVPEGLRGLKVGDLFVMNGGPEDEHEDGTNVYRVTLSPRPASGELRDLGRENASYMVEGLPEGKLDAPLPYLGILPAKPLVKGSETSETS